MPASVIENRDLDCQTFALRAEVCTCGFPDP